MNEILQHIPLSDVLLLLLAYLLGSIPFSLVVAYAAGAGDIRKQGSGNPGATNVARIAGKKAGVLAFLLDAGKGVLAVVLANRYGSAPPVALLAGGAAVIGHIFPVWLRFRGGKGVATTFAVLATLEYRVALVAMAIWLIIFMVGRISSLAAIFTMIATPGVALSFADKKGYALVYLTLFLAGLIILRHRENIRRLLAGEEKRLQ